MKKAKVEHEYTCDNCGKPATRSVQDIWHSYDITKDGDFVNEDTWDGNTNEFYCEKHYEEEYM